MNAQRLEMWEPWSRRGRTFEPRIVGLTSVAGGAPISRGAPGLASRSLGVLRAWRHMRSPAFRSLLRPRVADSMVTPSGPDVTAWTDARGRPNVDCYDEASPGVERRFVLSASALRCARALGGANGPAQLPWVQPGSSIAADDAPLGSWRVSILANSTFFAGVMHVHSLIKLITVAKVVDPYSPWTLLRGCAGRKLAIWLDLFLCGEHDRRSCLFVSCIGCW